jgi:RNA polymerase sigma-70 factor (ECF subfamily)
VATHLKKHSDDELLQLYRIERDNAVITELFERYYHLVYGICMKYYRHPENAKDSTMLIFEKLIDDIPKHDISFFKGWLYRVAQNHCLMQLRGQKHQTVSYDHLLEHGFEQRMEYDEGLHPAKVKEELLTKMEEAMADLNPEQRRCIELFYLEKKSYQDIIQETGFTFMQVKSYIQNGKRNLKHKIETHS